MAGGRFRDAPKALREDDKREAQRVEERERGEGGHPVKDGRERVKTELRRGSVA